MKKVSIITLASIMLMFIVPSLRASDNPYLEAMQKNILLVYTSQSHDELQQAVNALHRIGGAEKDKWEPYYYAAFGYIMMATGEENGEQKDALLDQGLADIEKAKLIKADESELVALEGFVHMIRITVDPASRGRQYSGLAMQTFGKAIAMNPDNPRALALMAQMQFGTAKFFGSDTAEACGTLHRALEKFEKYTPATPLAPQWGQEMTMELKKACP